MGDAADVPPPPPPPPGGRVAVVVRVRPGGEEDGAVVVDADAQALTVATGGGAGLRFRVDRVLDARADQARVFSTAAAEAVDGALRGESCAVLAYGQTGAGKTFTMSGGGGARRFADRGLCARALARVFAAASAPDAGAAFTVRLSYVEVYNEQLADLLADAPAAERLVVQEDRRGRPVVRGLSRPVAASEEQALELLFRGDTNRQIAAHCLNAASTRSHCILTVYVERRRLSDGDDADGEPEDATAAADVLLGKLHLVDLAGSERMKKTHAAGETLREAQHINRSLSFLEQVVLALGDRRRQHVPFRQSALTHLLKDALGGRGRAVLVACVWPAAAHADQTAATLRFATRMMRVKTQPVVNVAARAGAGGQLAAHERDRLQREIRQLREELTMYDALHGFAATVAPAATATTTVPKSSSSSSSSSSSEADEQVRAFVADAARRPPITSLRQVAALLDAFRALCLARDYDRPIAASAAMTDTPRRSTSKLVTQLRAIRALSQTPPGDNQADADQADSRGGDKENRREASEPATSLAIPSTPDAAAEGATESDKELFARFRAATPTPETALDVDAARQNLRAARGECAALSQDVNRVKLEIDTLVAKLETLRRRQEDGGFSGEEAVAEAVAEALGSLKNAKKRYRARYEALTEKRAEVQYLDRVKEQALQRMAAAFALWRDANASA